MPEADQILDGYHLIRLIGSGGFGDVWLCRLESTAEYRALKFLPQSRIRHLDRELQALKVYRHEIGHRSHANLIPIEHINRDEEGLFYVMPLADGPPDLSPEDDAWKPFTLETLIEERRSAAAWFSAGEIAAIFAPLAGALQILSDAGLVHRDIKPQNILFFGSEPQLADIGLVTMDETELSRLGTPGYLAPHWYLASQGNPDMWGLAATIYHCATGNHPDYMSRPANRWPPNGKQGMTAAEQKDWLALIGIVYRCTQEKPTERFVQFKNVADALAAFLPDRLGTASPKTHKTAPRILPIVLAVAALILLTAALVTGWRWHQAGRSQGLTGEKGTTASVSTDFENKLAPAVADFEALLKEARLNILGDQPPGRE